MLTQQLCAPFPPCVRCSIERRASKRTNEDKPNILCPVNVTESTSGDGQSMATDHGMPTVFVHRSTYDRRSCVVSSALVDLRWNAYEVPITASIDNLPRRCCQTKTSKGLYNCICMFHSCRSRHQHAIDVVMPERTLPLQINDDGNVLLDTFVKPSRPVTDYRTQWSGVHASDLKSAPTFQHARKSVLGLIDGCTLVGHSLDHDLQVRLQAHTRS